MRKIALLIEYDGTDFLGFQLQGQGRTVQGELERAIEEVTGTRSRVAGASRTDSGVHAEGQVVSFRTESRLPPETLLRALNFYLAEDVAVKAAREIDEDFDVRRRAVSREYAYTLAVGPGRTALHRRDAYWVAQPLDLKAMNRAAAELIGEKDISSFTLAGESGRSGRRRVYRAELERRHGDLIDFVIEASSFRKQQIRLMVGTLLEVGRGKRSVEDFAAIAAAAEPGLAGPAAPARGLCLRRVNYREPLFATGD